MITGRKFGRVRGEDAGVFPFGNVSLKMCAFSGSHFSTVLELDNDCHVSIKVSVTVLVNMMRLMYKLYNHVSRHDMIHYRRPNVIFKPVFLV